jgi:hypothetical protein
MMRVGLDNRSQKSQQNARVCYMAGSMEGHLWKPGLDCPSSFSARSLCEHMINGAQVPTVPLGGIVLRRA